MLMPLFNIKNHNAMNGMSGISGMRGRGDFFNISVKVFWLFLLVILAGAQNNGLAQELKTNHNTNHGISMHGTPELKKGFQRFTFTDSRPLTGGKLVEAKIGSFNSLNPFIVQGQAAFGLREYVFESLLARHNDEPFALYGLLAKRVQTPSDRSAVTFTLHPQAKFSDGTPVTIDDVIFSYEILKTKGRPNHRYYYAKVTKITRPSPNSLGSSAARPSPNSITFHFDKKNPDREMPLIMGLMPILPRHHYNADNFSASSLKIPLGSGPYIVADVSPGKQITFEKNPNYWGAKFGFATGRFNLNELVFDYYRDANSAFEAFKAGLVDIWHESNPTRWVSGYTFTAARDGRIIQETVATGLPSGLRGFVFNTRRPQFAKTDIRQALGLVFNFPWVNKTLYANAYQRTQSYFQNSALSSYQQPSDKTERVILRGAGLAKNIMRRGYSAPKGAVSGRDRQARQQAIALFAKHGFSIRNGRMVSNDTGAGFTFEILVQRREDERLALSYKRMLETIGVTVKVRLVDAAQYQNRLQRFDFDMIINNWYASLSPGNEQSFYWGSQAARQDGSRNYAGINNQYIDRAITALTQAENSDKFTSAARALDRLLMAGHYVIPLFHQPAQWVARWHHVEHNSRHALYGIQLDSWWVNADN